VAEKMVLKKIVFGVLLSGAVVFGKSTRDTQGAVSNDVALLRSEVSSLAAEISRLRADVNALKLNVKVISEEQNVKFEKIEKNVEEMIRKNDPVTLVDHHVNVLSSAFSKAINELLEKLQNVFNRIIALLNAQQKVNNSIAGTVSKQSDGIAYEVNAGETLDSIAAKHRVTREAIRSLNFIVDEDRLPAGQMLFIPQGQSIVSQGK
jgi:LysM repeat protein